MADDNPDPEWEEGEADEESTAAGRVPDWLTALCPMLPETLYAPYDPSKGRFCFKKLGPSEHVGLLCCSEPALAESYMAACLSKNGFGEVRRLSLDEACDIAWGRDARIDSVILIDDPRRPVVQTVR